ncbi:MAG: hypothetical protein KAI24_15935, partial [Planctomycetes bacterium]|nr:hypothetical protein [Planctomycetota bacterium]
MDAVNGPTRILGSQQVHERKAGVGQGQADAFRRALEERDDGTAAEREPEQPVRRELQRRPPIGRRDLGEGRHVDVVA